MLWSTKWMGSASAWRQQVRGGGCKAGGRENSVQDGGQVCASLCCAVLDWAGLMLYLSAAACIVRP